MSVRRLEADYLVVGCGAAGMAFTDALIADSDAQVVMVDRRHAPGGHWNDVYPFVRLHQPSAYYGVNSLPLGLDAIERHGRNDGFYERASGPEICGYFSRVMEERLLPSGKVRFFPMCEYESGHRFVSRLSGERYDVKVRKKLVDATYLEPFIPLSCKPPFEVAPDVRCVPPNALPKLLERAERYVIIGAGKTAMDAIVWLLDCGVASDDIRWIKPRESWLLNREFGQGGEFLGTLFEGLACQAEAAAQARSLDELFTRLSAGAQMLRVDESVAPTMYKAPTASTAEIEQLRRVKDVVRGRVRRLEPERVVLQERELPASPRDLYVHCAARGLNPAPAIPIFTEERITPQPIRIGLIPFNAALVGYVEATRADTEKKNHLCPPNRLPDVPLDWARGTLIGMTADYLWSREPDISDWLERARLNPTRGVRARRDEPKLQKALKRYVEQARPALERLRQLLARETHP